MQKITMWLNLSKPYFTVKFYLPSIFLHVNVFLLRYNSQSICLKCTTYWFDTFIYCNMIATIVLANTSVISHKYHFFFVVQIIKIESLRFLLSGRLFFFFFNSEGQLFHVQYSWLPVVCYFLLLFFCQHFEYIVTLPSGF